jgi:5-formyltetrahydrofolate cyclo-ligase
MESVMDEQTITRINELARKAKGEGLSTTEKEEQATLRKEYIAAIRKNLRGQLDHIDIKNADGSIENLGEKYGNKTKH